MAYCVNYRHVQFSLAKCSMINPYKSFSNSNCKNKCEKKEWL